MSESQYPLSLMLRAEFTSCRHLQALDDAPRVAGARRRMLGNREALRKVPDPFDAFSVGEVDEGGDGLREGKVEEGRGARVATRGHHIVGHRERPQPLLHPLRVLRPAQLQRGRQAVVVHRRRPCQLALLLLQGSE